VILSRDSIQKINDSQSLYKTEFCTNHKNHVLFTTQITLEKKQVNLVRFPLNWTTACVVEDQWTSEWQLFRLQMWCLHYNAAYNWPLTTRF